MWVCLSISICPFVGCDIVTKLLRNDHHCSGSTDYRKHKVKVCLSVCLSACTDICTNECMYVCRHA